MKHLWIVILVIFAIGQLADHCDALQNNLYYGNCAFDNNTLQVYTQVVVMDNQRQPIPSSPTPAPAQKPRKWYDYILHPFQRRTTTSPPPQPPAPFGQGNIINATVTYPPQVSSISQVITFFTGSKNVVLSNQRFSSKFCIFFHSIQNRATKICI